MQQGWMPKYPVVQCALHRGFMHVDDDDPELVLCQDCKDRMTAQDPNARARFDEAVAAGQRAEALTVLAGFRQAHR